MEFFWLLVVVGFGITAALLAYDAGYRKGVTEGMDMVLRRREALRALQGRKRGEGDGQVGASAKDC